MKTISVAQLRQNPGPMLADVQSGETYVVTQYRRTIARIMPLTERARVTGADVRAAFGHKVPADDGDWLAEHEADRAAEYSDDPWGSTG
jgi:antitoxin (DNA-binding transcriptional repressor) of toxin-antitoxin stability system